MVLASDAIAERVAGELGEGFEIVRLGSWAGADHQLPAIPHLAIVSAELEEGDAREAIDLIARTPEVPRVLLVTKPTDEQIALAHESPVDAVMALPLDLAALNRLVEDGGVHSERDERPLPSPFVGESELVRELWNRVLLASSGDSSVLVTGETGSGKELVARALHRFSLRRHGPFVAVNCAALPESLLESELFGHERGAFTGAMSQRKGRFELADGGTLFLDEIGDLPLGLQAKLLRVLEDKRFERLGGTESVEADVRVVAATHRDIPEQIERGAFRADLFFRLAALSLRVPPLRERRSDILPLWERLVAARADHRRTKPATSAAAKRLLLRYCWPGNIRELQNAAEHASRITTGDRILPADLPEHVAGARARSEVPNLAGLTLAELERLAILQTYEALSATKATAECLGISVRKLQYRMSEYRREGHLHLAAPPVEAPSHPKRILLAEDDDELRWALTELLRSEGYEIVAVADGNELLEHLGAAMLLERRDMPPDVIVSDIRMPGMSGVRLLESVRDRGWTTPVVLMSAFADREMRLTALELGATAFFDKPLDLVELQRVIARAVGAMSGGGEVHDVHGRTIVRSAAGRNVRV